MTVQAPDLDQIGRLLGIGRDDAGYLAAGGGLTGRPVIGLIRVDDPHFERPAAELDAALRSRGHAVDEEVAVSPVNDGDVGALTTQLSSAVLRFRSAGVTHVVFMSINATEPVIVMRGAESQGYEPRYACPRSRDPRPWLPW